MATKDDQARHWLPLLSKETRAVLAVFRAMPPGTNISYADLGARACKAAGLAAFDPQGADYGKVASARRIMLNHDGRVFEVLAREGVRHQTDEEAARTQGNSGLLRARNAARRAGRKLDTVDLNAADLNQQERALYQTQRQALALIYQGTLGKVRHDGDLPTVAPPTNRPGVDARHFERRRAEPGKGEVPS